METKNKNLALDFTESQKRAEDYKNEDIWRQLKNLTVRDALKNWLDRLTPLTKLNYACAFKRFADIKLVNPDFSMQRFSLINHEIVIDEIKKRDHWSEATKQARAAAYISFTSFLERRTQGIVKKALVNKHGVAKTFFKIRNKVKTKALSKQQTKRFLKELEKINRRDALIAKLLLQGGKRKQEVLSLKTEQIDYTNNRISFIQSKSRGTQKIIIITYPPHIMKELRHYVYGRSGLVFITRNNTKVPDVQLNNTFLKAGKKVRIPFRVTPHSLRVTLVTRLKELKINDIDIMKITGHANRDQLYQYDKTDPADNPSVRHDFI